jgi:acetyl/propionyl-CoA carboxylase alpha subunit
MLHAVQARIDSAMLEGHIDDCVALSRTIEEELSVMEAMQMEKELKYGTTAAIRKTRTSGDEQEEDDVLMRQMAVLLN